MLKVPMDESSHKLHLIDTTKRLGVSYHFEREIEDALQKIHDHDYKDEETLEATSFRFRLLRENGFNVPCETFNKFKDDEGNFKMSLTSDVKGLLELYEASHLRVHGEHIPEQALAFTTTHLDFAKTTSIEYPLSELVSHARKRPIRKGLPRLEARRYISIYQEDGSHNKMLLKFAKLDFNLLQNSHKEELSKISTWWKDLDFATKLPFSRDRLVERYFWILGVYFEPQYSFAREILTKTIAMTSIMDDIYDVYGTFDELELLTNAIERSTPSIHEIVLRGTLRCLQRNGGSDDKGRKIIPGEIVTKYIFDWASNNPKIVKASSIIARLMDDIVSHKFELERGHVASAVECYMKQHGVSEEKACDELNKQVDNAWKDINEELVIRPTAGVPMPVLNHSQSYKGD
ncbi:hypothetical protein CRYUN_Cryun39dG0081900 [Craigia yunnanensis]